MILCFVLFRVQTIKILSVISAYPPVALMHLIQTHRISFAIYFIIFRFDLSYFTAFYLLVYMAAVDRLSELINHYRNKLAHNDEEVIIIAHYRHFSRTVTWSVRKDG